MKKSLPFILLFIFVFNIADCISQNEMIEKFYKLFNYEWKLLKTSDQFKNANKLCYDVIEKEANNTKAVRDACLLTAKIQARENEIKNQTQEDNYIKENLERGLAICPNDWELNLELGLLYSNRGDKPNAIKYLTKSIKYNQSDIIAIEKIIENYEQSQLQVKKDSLAKLINYYNLYINLDLKDKDKYIKLYQYQIEVSDTEGAKATLIKAINNIEQFTEARLKLARLEEGNQYWQRAFDQYSSILSYEHSNREAKEGAEREKALLDKKKLQEIQITQIKGYLQSKSEPEWARGVEVCDEVLKEDQQNTEVQNYKKLLLVNICNFNFDQGKIRKKDNDWESAFKFFSRSLYFAQEDSRRDESIKYLKEVAAEAGKVNQVESIRNYAKKAFEKGDYTSALYSFVTVQTMNIGRDVQSDISLAEIGDYYLKGKNAFENKKYELTHAYITLLCNGDATNFPPVQVDSAKHMLKTADSFLKKDYTTAFLNENYENDYANKNWKSAKIHLEALLEINPNDPKYQTKLEDVNSKIPKGTPVVFITTGIILVIILVIVALLTYQKPTDVEFKNLKSKKISFTLPKNGSNRQALISNLNSNFTITKLTLIDLDWIEIKGKGIGKKFNKNSKDLADFIGQDTVHFSPIKNNAKFQLTFSQSETDPISLSAMNLSYGTEVTLERNNNHLKFIIIKSFDESSIRLSGKLKLKINPCQIYCKSCEKDFTKTKISEILIHETPVIFSFSCHSSANSEIQFELNNKVEPVQSENQKTEKDVDNYYFKIHKGSNLIIQDSIAIPKINNGKDDCNFVSEGIAVIKDNPIDLSKKYFIMKPNSFDELSIDISQDKFIHNIKGKYSNFKLFSNTDPDEKIPNFFISLMQKHPKLYIIIPIAITLISLAIGIIDLYN